MMDRSKLSWLYLPFGFLSLLLYLEAVATFGSYYFIRTIIHDYFLYIMHGVLVYLLYYYSFFIG
jgi:hypothetical protein